MTPILADVGTGVQTKQDLGLNPRATRFGFVPLWPITGMPSSAAYVWEIPANVLFPFRVFQVPASDNDGHTVLIDRLPVDQITDMHNYAGDKYFTEFPLLAALEDESAASEVYKCLVNPYPCTKYPAELKNTCNTCWLNWLNSPEPVETLSSAFKPDSPEYAAGLEARELLITAFDNSVAKARLLYDEALTLLESTTSGKSTFNDTDMRNTRHAHLDAPSYRRTQPNVPVGLGAEIAEGLKGFQFGAPTVTAELEAARERLKELETKLEEVTKAKGKENFGQKMARIKAEKAEETEDVHD